MTIRVDPPEFDTAIRVDPPEFDTAIRVDPPEFDTGVLGPAEHSLPEGVAQWGLGR
jgi:hypothetical protein